MLSLPQQLQRTIVLCLLYCVAEVLFMRQFVPPPLFAVIVCIVFSAPALAVTKKMPQLQAPCRTVMNMICSVILMSSSEPNGYDRLFSCIQEFTYTVCSDSFKHPLVPLLVDHCGRRLFVAMIISVRNWIASRMFHFSILYAIY